MPIITRLRIADRRATRTKIELDGEEWATLDSEVVLKHALKIGQALDQAEMDALVRDDAFIRARRIAAGLIATRPRGTEELRRRLLEYQPAPSRGTRASRRKRRAWGADSTEIEEPAKLVFPPRFDESTVDSVVDYFSEKGDLDDADFARRFIRNSLKLKSVGRLKLRSQLVGLGLSETVVEEALDRELTGHEDEEANTIRKLIDRRLLRLRNETPQRRREKMEAALYRAGFSPDTFRPILKERLNQILNDTSDE